MDPSHVLPSGLPDTETNEPIDDFGDVKHPIRDSEAKTCDARNARYRKWISSMFKEEGTCRKSDIGVAYHNLSVYGFGSTTDYQKTVANYPLTYLGRLGGLFSRSSMSRIDILRDFEGVVKSGEMLVALGRPGSGCSTFLKTIAGQTHGFFIDRKSHVNYQGVPPNIMHNEFRGECTYQAESDVHFPHLTVAQTLAVAAESRVSANAIAGSTRKARAAEIRDATVAALGLSRALDTKVGNNFVRGISGGERKRTSIAEVLVSGSPLQCWDNSTRGLDSANALEFVRTLRVSTQTTGSTAFVTVYQASQDIYDLFDKVVVLYEGHQIFFGRTSQAKAYFLRLGYACPNRATTADFLTSLTNPAERIFQEGSEGKAPRTAEEFARVWRDSSERAELLDEIREYNETFPLGGDHLEALRTAQTSHKVRGQRARSPYVISFLSQIRLCIVRGFRRIVNDLPPQISSIGGNAIISIILGSMFYNLNEDTSSFFGRGVLLFFVVLTNTFLGAFEGVQLWDQRPIVEKHFQYAFYHPAAEAIASMICDLPNKLLLTTFFNIPFYFLANMRRTPAAFFTFYLFAFVSLLTGSMLFRTIGAMSRTLTASIAPGADFILLLVIYTGFVLPIPSMHPWLRWFGYMDPVGYAFESLMINEFSGRHFPCSTFVPQGSGYLNISPDERMCATVGAAPNATTVDGDSYLAANFQYYRSHLWRNLGIILAIMVFLCVLYLLATEYISAQRSKGEVLIFRRSHTHRVKSPADEEAQSGVQAQTPDAKGEYTPKLTAKLETTAATFLWNGLCYDVKTKDGHRRILDDVEGWIRPGTLTALMGASGAGKTTLLNILANRASTGVIGGEKIVDQRYQNEGFARKIGYAQQQDVHLATATVREALIFSARLRQAASYSDSEKLEYVNQVIETLDMTRFADAVIGVPGQGLNVEQRKRVTIGVELAARPELLLFLDEPTSGLDSNTAWSICSLLRKLADNGQAILCTIHQPSGLLFQKFDRLLFLVNGTSVYFGDIGLNSSSLTNYFERHGARKCLPKENPAEWLLEITDHDTSSGSERNWAQVWQDSVERRNIKDTLDAMKKTLSAPVMDVHYTSSSEFASTFCNQLYTITRRNITHDWRTPSYLYSKIFLTLGAGLVNGFSFYHSANSLQGVQNQIFSVFLLFTLHSNLVQLILPQFLENRALYEINERPSRTYSWKVFILSNIIAELPWQSVLAVVQFVTWYYPLGMYQSAIATDSLGERGGLMFLLVLSFMIFSSTFSQMLGTVMPDAATGVNISALLWTLSLLFCGVLVSPEALPRFWIFMYRVSPVTYFLSSMVSNGVAGVEIICTANELVSFNPSLGQNCGSYLQSYIESAGGYLLNPNATQHCQFCPVLTTDGVIGALGIRYSERWKNFGITVVYSVVNGALALSIYWLFRVPKGPRRRDTKP